MSKRIHELAKEWGQNPKDLLAVAERVGIRGKRSQSALTDEEVTRLRDGLGLTPRPAVTVGSERVVAERVVTQRDSGADQLVTAREQTTETRLRPNVIRRRTAREVLKREELPAAVADDGAGRPTSRPRSTSSPSVPPRRQRRPPPEPAGRGGPTQRRAAPEPEPAPRRRADGGGAEPARRTPWSRRQPPSRAPRRGARCAAPPVRRRPHPPPRRRAGGSGARRAAPPPGFEEMRGVKVLGKIDLRKAVAPPAAAQPWRPARRGARHRRAQPAGDGAPKKKKGRKVIKKPDMADLMERDFHARRQAAAEAPGAAGQGAEEDRDHGAARLEARDPHLGDDHRRRPRQGDGRQGRRGAEEAHRHGHDGDHQPDARPRHGRAAGAASSSTRSRTSPSTSSRCSRPSRTAAAGELRAARARSSP